MKDLFLLDEDVVFLNHGSFGATPRAVFDVYQEWQRRLERQPVAFLGRDIGRYLAEAREALAPLVNADPGDSAYVLLTPNMLVNPLPIGSCMFYLDPTLALLQFGPMTVDSQGNASFALPIPNWPSLRGSVAPLQGLILDLAAPSIAFTNALELTLN